MKKTKIIIIAIIVFLIVSLLTYLNYDRLFYFFSNREWEIADSIGRIESENYIETIGTNEDFYVISSNGIVGYSDAMKKVLEMPMSWKEVVWDAEGDYLMIAEKNASNLSVYSNHVKVWENTISNANILGVSINKNGYSAVIYSQTGYKSLVRVYSNLGEEIFTSYFSSTYAVDVAISNDNKTLAIAEVDANGVNVVSNIKLINIQSASEKDMKKFDMESNELVSSIRYDNTNVLVIMTDMNIKLLKNNYITSFLNFKDDNIMMADISNGNNIFAIKTVEEGLFNSKCYVCSYSIEDVKNVKMHEIEDIPNKMVTMEEIVAVDCGNQIIFVNSAGRFVKKCEYKGQLKNYQLMNHGNTAALIFRNTIEFVKVGGF